MPVSPTLDERSPDELRNGAEPNRLLRTITGVRGTAVAEFTLYEGESVTFVLEACSPAREHPGTVPAAAEDPTEAERLFRETVKYWRRRLSKCSYQGRRREMVHRSALVLKLLTFAPTGAIVAAPTSALPESIGGERRLGIQQLGLPLRRVQDR